MSDDEDDEITMALPTENSDLEDDRSMAANRLAIKSRKNERDREIRKYQKLLRTKTCVEEHVIVEILRSLSASGDVGDERILLGSIALVNVLFTNYPHSQCIETLTALFNLEDISLSMFAENFNIRDLEWFKVAIAHGYFKANVDELLYTHENMLLTFAILEKHCLRYTKYSYVAYKVLQAWVNKWHIMFYESFTPGIESRLEAIIFSNWDNCISDIARRNTTEIFPTYLRAMSNKYEGFLNYIFHNCLQNLSWQNPTKYTILVEICKIFNDLDSILYSSIPKCILTSLTKSYLKSSGTLLYTTILGKLTTKEQWKNIFCQRIVETSISWEYENASNAVELLWEQWMKPTFAKFPDMFEDMFGTFMLYESQLSSTYLLKVNDRLGLKFLIDDIKFQDILESGIEHFSESVRLNAFAIICQMNNWKFDMYSEDPFILVKRFLCLNADASTASLRKGVLENFKIFFANVVKLAEVRTSINIHVRNYLVWLHEFLLDCFEIGSSYQRKIFGLNLYGVILNFMNDDSVDGLSSKSNKCEASLKCAHNLRLKMIEENQWNFVDARSAILLVKLVLDQTSDVKEKSTLILIRYFNGEVFTKDEQNVILQKATKFCNSSMFYEITSGSALMRVVSAWRFTKMNYVNFFLARAIDQLGEMRKDIFMSTVQGSPVYGALTAVLELGLADRSISDDTTRRILNFTEEAVHFFLSALSTKDKAESSPSGYSSSFEEMSLAIEESIRTSELNEDTEECVVSPAHQLVISCIWMSLKVCCELTAEIGSRTTTRKEAIRAVNIIVSVLLKCRHKGAITVAGLAITKLTKALLCKDEYDIVMKKHLIKLLRIGSDSKINLTRRGAGLTIMFHRIVSSDVRLDRPFLHFALVELLNSLKESPELNPTTGNEDCLRDSTRVRHLQFLQSLVADKSLQAQLVPYMEDICSTCFDHLQSPDWRVRNASLQLFGAIVPRLAGQSKETQLDYGIGNSIDHFVTHYPKLASKILTELETFVGSFDWTKIVRFTDLPIESNVLPILVLLSRMSTGGCDLIDYSSMKYIRRARETFKILLRHPVFHVRNVAAKAYAAFEPFSDIPCKLINMMPEKFDPRFENYDHGVLIAQSYLGQKLCYEEMPTTQRLFIFHKHMVYSEALSKAWFGQFKRAVDTWQATYTVNDENSRTSYTIHNMRDHVANATLLYCLVTSNITTMSMKFLREDDNFGYLDLSLIENLRTRGACPPRWLTYVEPTWKCYSNMEYVLRMYEDDWIEFNSGWLEFLVDNALKFFHDPSNFHTFYYLICLIRHYYYDDHKHEAVLERLYNINGIQELSTMLMEIDEKSSRRRAISLKCWGFSLAIEINEVDEVLFEKAINFVQRMSGIDNVAIKKMVLNDVMLPLFKKYSWKKPEQCVLDSRLKSTKVFLSAVTSLLMDEDPDIRELAAKRVNRVISTIDIRVNGLSPRATLHKLFKKLPILWYRHTPIGIHDALVNLKALTELINVKSSSSGIKSPYDHDDDLQHDHTQFINMLMYYAKMMKEPSRPRVVYDYCEVQQFNGITSMKYELQREARIDVRDVKAFLELSTSDYLSLKKSALVKMINDSL